MSAKARAMPPPDHLLATALAQIADRKQLRDMTATEPAPSGRVRRAGRALLDFSSNDYLGLARHPLLIERAAAWARDYGAGAGASRLVTGTLPIHLALERRIAEFKGTEAALIFASGWQANAAVLSALLGALPGALVFTDRLVHASLHHGIAAAGAREIRYRHNDLDHLESLLAARESADAPRLIVTETLFSMDGDSPDIEALAALACRHEAFLYLDEAHATGVLGPGGKGLSSLAGDALGLAMGTFSKAFGGFGAYVAGSRLVCDYLVNACSGFIFTTAPPPAVLGAVDAALDLVPGMDAERAHLAALGDGLRSALRAAGRDVGCSTSQIVPLIVGEPGEALASSERLAKAGILAAAIRPPSVPPGTSRLRIALRACHDSGDTGRLLDALLR